MPERAVQQDAQVDGAPVESVRVVGRGRLQRGQRADPGGRVDGVLRVRGGRDGAGQSFARSRVQTPGVRGDDVGHGSDDRKMETCPALQRWGLARDA